MVFDPPPSCRSPPRKKNFVKRVCEHDTYFLIVPFRFTCLYSDRQVNLTGTIRKFVSSHHRIFKSFYGFQNLKGWFNNFEFTFMTDDYWPTDEHASSTSAEKSWLFQVNFSRRNVRSRLHWCDSGQRGSLSPVMLAGDGKARARMLTSSEAQKRQGDSNSAIHHTID